MDFCTLTLLFLLVSYRVSFLGGGEVGFVFFLFFQMFYTDNYGFCKKKKKDSFLFFNLYTFYFFFLYQLGLPAICLKGILSGGILALFLTLARKHLVSQHILTFFKDFIYENHTQPQKIFQTEFIACVSRAYFQSQITFSYLSYTQGGKKTTQVLIVSI